MTQWSASAYGIIRAMFSYIDPTVRERLVAQGKLFRINHDGEQLSYDAPTGTGQTISILGPIPMPLDVGERRIEANWYAAVRSTELTQVEALASDLRARGGQQLFSHLVSPLAVNSCS